MTIRIENKNISLSVRDLISFNPSPRKVLSSFPLPQRGKLGKEAQARLQQKKESSFGLFHKEMSVSYNFNHRKYHFSIYGRVDGIYELPNKIEVEEIKSVILNTKDFKNLKIYSYPEFIEQVLIYSYLLHFEKQNYEILPIITLINLINNKSRSIKLEFDPGLTKKLILQRCNQIIDKIHLEQRIYQHRLKELAKVSFQLPEKRAEQQEMMMTVESILHNHEHLMISAPTGTGKTAAVLFPAINFAVRHQKRILYLTSKTTQQEIIRKTIQLIVDQGLDLTISFLRASKSMCANDVVFCHEDYCPYVQNYQDEKLKNRLFTKLSKIQILDPEVLFHYSKQAMICPAEIMFDLAASADIVVGDYNYLFDSRIQLKQLFQRDELTDWLLIIDEAHNLYQRTIDSLSPELKRTNIMELSKSLLNDRLKVYRDLKQSVSEIASLLDDLQREGEIHYSDQRYFTFQLDLSLWQESFHKFENAYIKYLIFKIQKNMMILEDPFEVFYYQFRTFIQIASIQSTEFISFFDAAQKGKIKIVCCDPSEHISNIINKFSSVIAMSATLDPILYYRDILGFPKNKTILSEVSSPFSTRNRQVVILPHISTYYRDRANLYYRYAEIIKDVISIKNGNYIIFCPSFEFLQNVYLYLGNIETEIITQRRQMTEEDRDYILSELKASDVPKLLLAVMGGIFSEGVDFRGDMCIGVIIFSPALPQITFERELIRDYYETKHGSGFKYAYLYPGINKVIQSVGRLIRSQQDKGIIVLADERFADDEINQLLPEYWFEVDGDVVITEDYKQTIKAFWQRFEK